MQVDGVIQSMFQAVKNVKWKNCESNNRFEWYYAENFHYVIHDKKTNAYWFIKAKSPINACDIAIKKMETE